MDQQQTTQVDVLCVGAATYDLVYSVDHHPEPDEKMRADFFIGCGGGPAANAAVTVSRLGLQAAFSGYLGNDILGQAHINELLQDGVLTDFIARGDYPTATSVVMVKPDGGRALVNYKDPQGMLYGTNMDFSSIKAKVLLLDGHESEISSALAIYAKEKGIISVLDAGSVHRGTEKLKGLVDYLVCSEKFALEYTGELNEDRALARLNTYAPNIIITLGDKGLIWKNSKGTGSLEAYRVNVMDTTGAGDVFHGALAACLAQGIEWLESLRYASAAAALSCTKMGARLGIPSKNEVAEFLLKQK